MLLKSGIMADQKVNIIVTADISSALTSINQLKTQITSATAPMKTATATATRTTVAAKTSTAGGLPILAPLYQLLESNRVQIGVLGGIGRWIRIGATAGLAGVAAFGVFETFMGLLKNGFSGTITLLGMLLKVLSLILKPIDLIFMTILLPLFSALMPLITLMNFIFRPLRMAIANMIKTQGPQAFAGAELAGAIAGLLVAGPFGALIGAFLGPMLSSIFDSIGKAIGIKLDPMALAGIAFLATFYIIPAIKLLFAWIAGQITLGATAAGVAITPALIAGAILPLVAILTATAIIWDIFGKYVSQAQRTAIDKAAHFIDMGIFSDFLARGGKAIAALGNALREVLFFFIWKILEIPVSILSWIREGLAKTGVPISLLGFLDTTVMQATADAAKNIYEGVKSRNDAAAAENEKLLNQTNNVQTNFGYLSNQANVCSVALGTVYDASGNLTGIYNQTTGKLVDFSTSVYDTTQAMIDYQNAMKSFTTTTGGTMAGTYEGLGGWIKTGINTWQQTVGGGTRYYSGSEDPNIKGYQMGGLIGKTGMYMMHAGERVTPAGGNAGNNPINNYITVNAEVSNDIDIRDLADKLSRYMHLDINRRVSYASKVV